MYYISQNCWQSRIKICNNWYKIYVSVVTLSAQDNVQLLLQLNADFERTIKWNKYQSELTLQTRKRYLNYLIDPSFEEINRLFVLLF